MILVKLLPSNMVAGDLLVAQNPANYECLVFSESGEAFTYDPTGFNGRYKPNTNHLPVTEAELRTDFFGFYVAKKKEEAKQLKESGRFLPLTVTFSEIDYIFDMHKEAQENIKASLISFESAKAAAITAGWPDDGTLPWVLADDSVLPVTITQLQQVHDAAVVRGYQLHNDYQVTKATLQALYAVETT